MTKRVLKRISLGEISAVTVPAQTGAKAVLMKRRDGPFTRAVDLVKSVDPDWVSRVIKDAKTFDEMVEIDAERERVSEATSEFYDLMWTLHGALNSIVEDTELTAEDKAGKIQESIEQFQESIGDSIPDVTSQAVDKAANETTDPALSGVFHAGEPGSTQSEQETPMAVAKSGDLEKQIAEINKKLDTETKARETAEALAELNDVQKAHYAGLEGDAKDEFLAKSKDERAAIVKKAAEADEVLVIHGETIRKSETTTALFNVLKKQAEEAKARDKEFAKAQEEAAIVKFSKLAEDEYPHLAGSYEDKGKALHAISKLSDEDSKRVLNMLKVSNAANIFSEIGSSNTGDAGEKSTLAKSIEAEQAAKPKAA